MDGEAALAVRDDGSGFTPTADGFGPNGGLGLRGMLAGEADFEVVGEAASGVEAVRPTERERPDVVLMDLQMPEMDGATATAEIAARFPATRVLVLTTYDIDADILRAVEAGATGYLLKDTPRERLFPAIRAAARGETVLAPTVATRLVSRMRQPGSEALTCREIEVLELVARGSSNADIAAALFISEATVKTHLLHVFAKLGVDDRTAAVVAALERGIIALPAAPARRDLTSAAPLSQAVAVMRLETERIRRDPVRRQRVHRRAGDGHHPPILLALHQPGRTERGRQRRPGPVQGQLRGRPGRGRAAGRDRGGRPGHHLPARRCRLPRLAVGQSRPAGQGARPERPARGRPRRRGRLLHRRPARPDRPRAAGRDHEPPGAERPPAPRPDDHLRGRPRRLGRGLGHHPHRRGAPGGARLAQPARRRRRALLRRRAAPAAHRRLPAGGVLPRRGPPQRLAEGGQAAPAGRLAAELPHAGVLGPPSPAAAPGTGPR